eukprot:5592748-Prymnesium_polylepis.1
MPCACMSASAAICMLAASAVALGVHHAVVTPLLRAASNSARVRRAVSGVVAEGNETTASALRARRVDSW